MSTSTPPPVIRIVKKKYAHEAHHGGSWKVAYADFVTAMMAFFLVMWIVSMNEQVRDEIQSYFNNPSAAAQSRAGISKLASGGTNPVATGSIGLGAKSWRELALEAQKERFTRVRDTLEREIAGRPDLSHLGKHVEISVTASGLDIELIEATQSLFFQSGSPDIPPATVRLLGTIARELGRVPNPVAVEGHTDSIPYHGRDNYSNWELSADRANAARRVMEAHGLRPHQVVEVRGCADSKLRDPRHPTAAFNRRVSILVNFVDKGSSAPNDDETADPVKADTTFDLHIKPEEQ
jgi:chemotaxis protein MotB